MLLLLMAGIDDQSNVELFEFFVVVLVGAHCKWSVFIPVISASVAENLES